MNCEFFSSVLSSFLSNGFPSLNNDSKVLFVDFPIEEKEFFSVLKLPNGLLYEAKEENETFVDFFLLLYFMFLFLGDWKWKCNVN